MMPTWIVCFTKRPLSLGRPFTRADYEQIEVAGSTREDAATAFRRRFPAERRVVSVSTGSVTGFA